MISELPLRSSVEPPAEDEAPTDWTLALAGGDGIRLGDYVLRRFGKRIPKQYCALLGQKSMLQHTLDRMNAITPAARTLAVIGSNHAEYLPQFAGRADHVVRQPSARDTGVALYVGLAMIKRWAPEATVTVTPTDHYVSPAGRYIDHVVQARTVATRLRDRVVVIGVRPTEPDPELGYFTVGPRITEVPEVRALSGFVEKPDAHSAQSMIGEGALWNTMVTVGTVDALWELGRAADPHLLDILDSLVPLIGTPDEDDAIDYIYRAYLPVSFSHDIVQRVPERLCALELVGVDWSDWGKPERIETVLAMRRSRALTPKLTNGRVESQTLDF